MSLRLNVAIRLALALALVGLFSRPSSALVVPEVEPNDTFAQADASPIQIYGSMVISGSIAPVGDLDNFRLVVGAASVIRFETFDATGQDCVSAGLTTRLRLFDGAGSQLWTDAASGIQGCSALVVSLGAGVFYVRVEEEGNNALLAAYVLQVSTQSEAGTESEPNDDAAMADANLDQETDAFVSGAISNYTDSDFFSITVAAGQSIRAETIDAVTDTCDTSINSWITLYAPDGTSQLENDDDSGRGTCSLIDGTGATPANAGAHGLPAGTYFLEVRATLPLVFSYRLDVRITESSLPFSDGFELGDACAWSAAVGGGCP